MALVLRGRMPLLALLGITIHIVTDDGTVKISGTDPNMMVRIDSREIRIENLGVPITLRTGPHDLVVARGDLVVKTQTFQIHRGQETSLEVTYIPKPPVTKQGGDRKAASPTQKPQPLSPQPMPGWTNSIGIKLVRIEAGEFLMGSTKDQVDQLMRLFPDSKRESFDDEQPQHTVRSPGRSTSASTRSRRASTRRSWEITRVTSRDRMTCRWRTCPGSTRSSSATS